MDMNAGEKEQQGPTGEELYSRFMSGDEQALEELVGIYRGGLTLFINGFVHDMDEAENLMIDVFAELIASGSKFKGKSSFKTYLFAIGRNLALHHLRRNKANQMPFSDTHDLPDINKRSEEVSPETIYLKEEEARNIYDNIMTLKEEYSQALYLIYFEDMSYAEAGKVLKKSESQIAGLCIEQSPN